MISIIIPTLNEEKAIGTTLGQIKDKLTEVEYEIIVADGGSTDRTREIAARYATVIDTGHEHTIAWNRNRAAEIAKGEFFAFVDADATIPDPNRFYKFALEDFARDPELLAVVTNIAVIPENARVMDRIVYGFVSLLVRFNNNVLHRGATPGKFQMIRRSAFERIHGYQEHLVVTEDNDIIMRLARIGKTRLDPRLTIFHTGRRAHIMGWPRLLWLWTANYFSFLIFNRSYDKKWKETR
ncbi:MAG: glycosyltransferase [Candidatus Pacebacteria bacterium]|nr:glycosyltransferase [Candidatus Paceibacterota bacterium]